MCRQFYYTPPEKIFICPVCNAQVKGNFDKCPNCGVSKTK